MDSVFVAAVAAIYQAAADPSLWPRALQAIAECFDDVGAILIYGRDDGRFGVIASPALQELVAEYVRDWSDRDIRAIRAREGGYFATRDVITDRDVVTVSEMETDPTYANFLSGHGLRYFAAVSVSPDPHVEVAVSIQRRHGKSEFSETELADLGKLGTHIEQSLRLSIRLFDAELLQQGLGEALTRIGIGVFALDSLGRVVFSNPAGDTLLGDELALIDNRLVATHRPDHAALERAIGHAAGQADIFATGRKPIMIRRLNADRPLVVYILPIGAASDRSADFLTRARSIVLVIDPDDTGPADASLVRDILGLTLGEARVATLVGSGLPPREAAVRLGISEETARTVLKRVFSKAGVSRQSELTALLTKLALK